jgi:hypothetical protein
MHQVTLKKTQFPVIASFCFFFVSARWRLWVLGAALYTHLWENVLAILDLHTKSPDE